MAITIKRKFLKPQWLEESVICGIDVKMDSNLCSDAFGKPCTLKNDERESFRSNIHQIERMQFFVHLGFAKAQQFSSISFVTTGTVQCL